jgi:hypothetical protein
MQRGHLDDFLAFLARSAGAELHQGGSRALAIAQSSVHDNLAPDQATIATGAADHEFPNR